MCKKQNRWGIVGLVLCLAALAGAAYADVPVIGFDADEIQNEAGEFCPSGLDWELSVETVEATLGIALGEPTLVSGTTASNYWPDVGIRLPQVDAPYFAAKIHDQLGPLIYTFKEGKLSATWASMPLRENGMETFESIVQAYADAFGSCHTYASQVPMDRGGKTVPIDTHGAFWLSPPRVDGRVAMLQLRLSVIDNTSYSLSVAMYLLDEDHVPAV